MSKYICKVLQTEECNEDFAPDRDMIEGVTLTAAPLTLSAEQIRKILGKD